MNDGDSYQVRAYANDTLGNTGLNYTVYNITLDKQGPVTTILAPVNFTNITSNSYVLNATSTDTLSEVDTVIFLYRENDTESWSFACSDDTEPYNCTWNLTLLNDGDSYQIRAYANDTYGTIGANYTVYNITLDRQGPITTILDPVNFTNITVNTYFLSAAISDAFSEADIVTFLYRENDTESWSFACSDATGPYTCLWNLILLSDGDSYQVRAYANDSLGNIGANYTVYNITVTRLDINITLVLPLNKSGDNDANLIFEYNVTSLLSIANCSLLLNNEINQTNGTVTRNEPQYFYVNGLGVARHNWSIICYNTQGAYSTSKVRVFDIILATDFRGETTDFSDEDTSSIVNLTLDIPDTGKIIYNEDINLSFGADLNALVDILNNNITVDVVTDPRLNKSAMLYLYNLTYEFTPVILKDNIICDSSTCTLIIYSDYNLSFNATHMASYTTIENSLLEIWDETDPRGGSQIRMQRQQVEFYANYTNRTSGEIINGTGVHCNITFSDIESAGMEFNATSQLYVHNRSFANYGLIPYNITCNGSVLGFEMITENDIVNIIQDTITPNITLGNPLNETWSSSGNFTFYYNTSDNIGVANCSLILNNEINLTNTTIYETQWNNFTVYNLPENKYFWTINCTDVNGNIGAAATQKIVYVDNTEPAIQLISPFPEENLQQTFNFVFKATDNLDEHFYCNISVNGEVNESYVEVYNNTQKTVPKTLPDGIYLWNVTCWDNLSYTNTSITWNFTISTQPPLISNIKTEPNITGYGKQINISADVVDSDGVSWVRVNVSYPVSETFEIFNIGGNTYSGFFNNTWALAEYNFTVYAEDDKENREISAINHFTINITADISLETEKDIYGDSEDVDLNASFINSTGNTDFSGYLIMQMYANISDSWVLDDTIINDSETGKIRNISSLNQFNLSPIWNGPGEGSGWNTYFAENTTHMVYVALVDPNGDILEDGLGGYLNATYVFFANVTPPIWMIDNINALPNYTGIGQEILISAELSYPAGFSWVRANITKPDGNELVDMSLISGKYLGIFTNSWANGVYNFTIISRTTTGQLNESQMYNFTINSSANIQVMSQYDYYFGNQIVNLTEDVVSQLNNTGNTNISGYLIMGIENNNTGSWLNIATIIDDTSSNKRRNITNNLSLAGIWNGPGEGSGWDTNNYAAGYYRVKAELADNNGNVLEDGLGGYLNATYIFYLNVSPPVWTIINANDSNPMPLEYVEFYANWTDDVGLKRWEFYWDPSGGFVLGGEGNFSGFENQSSIILEIPAIAEASQLNFYFRAYDLNDTYADTNQSNISVQDVTPPVISNERTIPVIIYNNETAVIAAAVTDVTSVDSVWANITIPDSTIINVSMIPAAGEYRANYTPNISGIHNITIYANDTNANLQNSSLVQLYVYNYSNVSFVYPLGGNYRIYSELDMICEVVDAESGDALENYNVSFYVNEVLLGTNSTNSSGHAKLTVNLTDETYTEFKCNITTYAEQFYGPMKKEDTTIISILVPNVTLDNVIHENLFNYNINEFETYDLIDFVNITVNNTGGADASSVNITLNVLQPNNQVAPWFTTSTNDCGNINESSVCISEFDNSGPGYNISTSTAGTYNWNVTSFWQGGGNPPGISQQAFTIHHMPDNYEGSLNHTTMIPGQNTTYIFNITNPWSGNLSGFNITINCPVAEGLNCTCYNYSSLTCNYGEIEALAFAQVIFNVTTTNSTPLGDYGINVSLTYINPGNEKHTWSNQEISILHLGVLNSVIVDYPHNITRGDKFNLTGYADNIGINTLQNLTLNWSLPSAWTNITGGLELNKSALLSNELFWNNITVNTSIAASRGPQQIILRTAAFQTPLDTDSQIVIVYANTSITGLNASPEPAYRGDTVQLTARLKWDDNTDIQSQTILFQDTVPGTTNVNGIATVSYQIPSDAPLGLNNFTINASFSESNAIYARASFAGINITVLDRIIINASSEPLKDGYGQIITIYANLTTGVSINTIYANITYPNGSNTILDLNPLGGNLFSAGFNETWQLGIYNFTVFANNTQGYFNESEENSFNITVSDILFSVVTDEDEYGSNQNVNLSRVDQSWWNPAYIYRTRLNISNPSSSSIDESYAVNLTLNTTGPKFLSSGDDIRIVYYNGSSHFELPRDILEPDSNMTQIWFYLNSTISSGDSDNNYFIYYNNPSAAPAPKAGIVINFSQHNISVYDTSQGCSGSRTIEDDGYTLRIQGNCWSKINKSMDIQENTAFDFIFKNDGAEAEIHGIGADNDNIASSNLHYQVWGTQNWADTTYKDYSSYNPNPHSYTIEPSWTGSFDYLTFSNDDDNPPRNSNVIFKYVKVIEYITPLPNISFYEEEHYINYTRLINNGDTNLSGYLLMNVEYNNSVEWENIKTVVDDSSSSKKRTLNFNEILDLVPIWNSPGEGSGWNTGNNITGIYRVIAYLTDPYGKILTDNSGINISGYYVFNIETEGPDINLTTPENLTWTKNSTVEFRYIVNDSYTITNCSLYLNLTGPDFELNQTQYNLTPLAEHGFTPINLTDGFYKWRVLCYDSLDNHRWSGIYYVTVDTTPPNITLNYPVNYDNVSHDFSINFNWTANDSLAGTLNCSLIIDDSVNRTNISVISGISANYSIAVIDSGYHNWTVNCSDPAGNFFTALENNFTVIQASELLDIRISSDNSSIILNWSFVQLADSYNVYITTNLSEGFDETANATGITDLNYTDPDANTSYRRYYKIGAVKGTAVSKTEKTAAKHQFDLYTTWNLVSIAVNKSNWLLYNGTNNGEDIFTKPAECIGAIWRYNNATDSFEKTDYLAGRWIPATGSENFTGLDPSRGYWFEVNETCNATFVGLIPVSNLTIALDDEWNVMGWHSVYSPELFNTSGINPVEAYPEDSFKSILRYNPIEREFEVTVYMAPFKFFIPAFTNLDFMTMDPDKGYYFDLLNQVNWTHDPNKGR
ncbi:hypothetical protein JXB41_08130 [Candidatus Woesearchaeota archaeon]|nr:hypothetical protein [Candidatus Woesearchaeota archaeon]